MRYTVQFTPGEANIRLEVTLPLPEGPLESVEVPGGKRPSPALSRIEALVPEFLSELLYRRIPEQGCTVLDRQTNRHEENLRKHAPA
jgi:hypothetical protein